MDILLKTYASECKKNFAPLGFKRSGNNHWRVVNDVYQAFHLKRMRGGGACQILFGIIPLCRGIEAKYVRQESMLIFLPYFLLDCDIMSWSFDPKSEVCIQSCVKNIMGFLQKDLFPYFERGYDCTSAYEENRKIYSCLDRRRNEPNNAEDSFFGGYPEYCMALKNKKYAHAEGYLAMVIDSRKKHLNYVIQEVSPPETYIETENLSIAEDIAMLERVSARDEPFIQNWIGNNERKSLESLGLIKHRTE